MQDRRSPRSAPSPTPFLVNARHEPEQFHDVVRLGIAGEFLVQGGNIDHDPLGVAPAVIVGQGNVQGRFVDGHVCIEPLPGFVANVGQVIPNRLDASVVGNGAVSGDDGFDIQGQHVVAGVDPVADRPHPDNRMPFDEQDVAGEHRSIVRNVHQNVPSRVSGAHLAQFDPFVAHRHVEPAFEGARRRGWIDAVETNS